LWCRCWSSRTSSFSARYRVNNFLKPTRRSLPLPVSYPRRLVIFALRTTLTIPIGICCASQCATFIFGFSSTVPTAIAMVAEDSVGGTYGSTVNRVSSLIAGTVVPSILSFFVCKASSDYVYNALNNVVLLWGPCTCGSALAGMTSACMAALVLLDHSCRDSLEIVIHPRSSRGLLRSNIQQQKTSRRPTPSLAAPESSC
jgi:hypothetical protein